MSDTGVRTILCQSEVRGGHVLRVVELMDTRLALDLDGALLSGSIWEAKRVDDCIEAFLSRKLELARAAEVDAGKGEGKSVVESVVAGNRSSPLATNN